MPRFKTTLRLFALLCACSCALTAQTPATPPAPPSNKPPAAEVSSTAGVDDLSLGVIPYQKGFNAALTVSSQHDSASGWSNIFIPNVAYRYDSHFSAEISTPFYNYIEANTNIGTATNPNYALKTHRLLWGDTTLSFHYDLAVHNFLLYSNSVSFGFATGNSLYGLSNAQTTYDFDNRFELNMPFSPFVEMGVGDASSLVNQRILRNIITVGPLAHFAVGSTVDLPLNLTFTASAYESLPIGDQKLYDTVTRGKRTVTTVIGRGVAEDNGFISSLDIPLERHVTLTGFYNRSLREHNDTAGFAFTFLLRPLPRQTIAH